MKSLCSLLLCFGALAAAPRAFAWANATGGAGPAGTTPVFALETNDGGATAPYGFQFVDVWDVTAGWQFVDRYVPTGNFYPGYSTFTWSDPRGASYSTHTYWFNFTGWSPGTSHYPVGTVYADYTITTPASATIAPSTTTVGVGETMAFTVSGSSSSGLNSIGLESADAAGNAIANLGAMGTGATYATQTFSWTPTAPGTYYFLGYAWNASLTSLARTPSGAITVNAVANGVRWDWLSSTLGS